MNTSKQRTEEIVRRAAAQRAARAKNRRAWLLAVTAGCLLLAVAAYLILFIPYPSALPDISRFSGSPYYPLMQRLNELTYTPPRYQNNFEAWFSGLGGWLDIPSGDAGAEAPDANEPAHPAGGGDSSAAGPGGSGAEGNGSVEVTDNQEAGVTEGDLFKRTRTHLFYLNNQSAYSDLTVLSSFTLAAADSAPCGRLEIAPEADTYFTGEAEMYLSEDGGTVTVFRPVGTKSGGAYTAVIAVDVSDPARMREAGRVYLSGSYVTSRVVGEEFLLVSNFAVRRDPDFSDESQFLPQFGAPGALESLPMEDIVWSEDADAARYTVLCRLGEDLSLRGCEAFLSFSRQVYVSQDNVFLTRGYTAEVQACGEIVSGPVRESRTEIACVSYGGGGLSYRGCADVAGSVHNQYSMDEAEDTLRVVTTLSRSEATALGSSSVEKNAALYVVGLDDFSLLAALENFAPAGEVVTSVRFEEDVAWVCTAVRIELTDPVFRIDLTDLSHITYTETGDIDGYSSSLIDFTGGTLLGVGYGEDGGFKAEVYEKAEGAVLPVAAYERPAFFSEEYKSYLIDRENGLLGLHLCDFAGWEDVYVLLRFDGSGIAPVLELALEGRGFPDRTRACIAEGWLYVVWGEESILAAPVPALA